MCDHCCCRFFCAETNQIPFCCAFGLDLGRYQPDQLVSCTGFAGCVVLHALRCPAQGKVFGGIGSGLPFGLFSGFVAAFLAETTYIAISGNPLSNFGTSFTSSLLWYRLFPNITYPNGILNSIAAGQPAGFVHTTPKILA